jgi:hypothetical protein
LIYIKNEDRFTMKIKEPFYQNNPKYNIHKIWFFISGQ